MAVDHVKTYQHLVQANVRRLRMLRQMSQHQLAVEADITRAYIGRLESTGQNITLETLYKLAHALEVDPRDLLKPPEEWRE